MCCAFAGRTYKESSQCSNVIAVYLLWTFSRRVWKLCRSQWLEIRNVALVKSLKYEQNKSKLSGLFWWRSPFFFPGHCSLLEEGTDIGRLFCVKAAYLLYTFSRGKTKWEYMEWPLLIKFFYFIDGHCNILEEGAIKSSHFSFSLLAALTQSISQSWHNEQIHHNIPIVLNIEIILKLGRSFIFESPMSQNQTHFCIFVQRVFSDRTV